MTREIGFMNVQCVPLNGNSPGCFLTENKGAGDRVPISPVFPDLVGLFGWMKENGWALGEYTPEGFVPWRVSRPTPTEDGSREG